MKKRVIDMTKDPRHEQFEYFASLTDPYAGVTCQVDITAFMERLAQSGAPFFLAFTYEVLAAANAGTAAADRGRWGGGIRRMPLLLHRGKAGWVLCLLYARRDAALGGVSGAGAQGSGRGPERWDDARGRGQRGIFFHLLPPVAAVYGHETAAAGACV